MSVDCVLPKTQLNVDKILAFKLPFPSDYFSWLHVFCEKYTESRSGESEDRRLYGKLKSETNNIIISAYKWSTAEFYILTYIDSSDYILDRQTITDKDELLSLLSQLK